ncbi:hypothetical protein O2V63_04500 [Modestobacter sp. VKM Ac-2977]|uniref:hypothetical protein n=1 Tax=Modestobacter sp. VKM Ac-2977 TaxID=3004131 RepID=UPI0022AAA9C8|nr:hypothetical protein [Modestobacter sp. VKM Ac-2977]MCZ2819587.1 hypothetical protein [Modestobacter sp. VKM Ac-2977]
MIFNSISDRIELLVTPELHNEVDRVIDETDRRRLQSIIDTYPRLRVAPDVLARTRAALIESLGHAPAGARDVSDLNHIAYAAAAGVSVVATRDLAVLQRLTAPAEQVGLRIVSPDDLVALVDERESAPAYTPAALLDTGYQVAEAGVSDNVVLERFVDGGAGERKKDFRLRVGELARQRPSSSRLLFTDPDGEPVALLGYAPSEQTLEVTVARLRPSSLRSTIAAQVVSGVRTAALARQKNLIHVTDPFADSAMYQAFLADGYRPTSSGVMAATVGGVLSVNELRSQLRSLRRSLSPDDGASVLPSWLDVDIQPDLVEPNTAASIERQLRPLKLYDAPIPAWMVPIKPHYASQLFGYPAELFPRGDELGISVEQVYYRAGRSGEEAPGRIFWYVSGSRNGEVIGTSELVEVADGSPDVLWRGIDDSVSTLGKRLRIVLIRKTQCAR